MKDFFSNRYVAWGSIGLYMGLIWYLSSLSIVNLPIDRLPFQDKGAHFMEFGALAFLLAYAAFVTWTTLPARLHFLFAAFGASSWGALDEVHQAFTPGRSSDWHDFVADSLGATLGALSFMAFVRVLSRITAKREST